MDMNFPHSKHDDKKWKPVFVNTSCDQKYLVQDGFSKKRDPAAETGCLASETSREFHAIVSGAISRQGCSVTATAMRAAISDDDAGIKADEDVFDARIRYFADSSDSKANYNAIYGAFLPTKKGKNTENRGSKDGVYQAPSVNIKHNPLYKRVSGMQADFAGQGMLRTL